MISKKQITKSNKILLVPTIVLTIFVLYLLGQLSYLRHSFPFISFSDGTSYLGQLHLLKEYGYLKLAPNWYNGIINLKYYPPGWFFFMYPLYLMINNIGFTAFISLVFNTAAIGILFHHLGKMMKIPKSQSYLFFLIVLVSPSAFMSWWKLGRLPEMFSFIFFLISFIMLLEFRKKEINKNFIGIGIPYALTLIVHPGFFLCFSLLLLGLFLQRTNKERKFIIMAGFFALILSSFFWVGFIDNKEVVLSQQVELFGASQDNISINNFKIFHNFVSFGTLVSSLFIAMLILHLYEKKINKKKIMKTIAFYIPVLILIILYVTKLIVFVPIFKSLYTLIINTFLLFLSLYLFYQLDLKSIFSKNANQTITILISLFAISFILLPIIYPIDSTIDENKKNFIELAPLIEEKVIFMPPFQYSKALISYSTIYHNISTPDGWLPQASTINHYTNLQKNKQIIKSSNDCNIIIKAIAELDSQEIIDQGEKCNLYEICNLKLKAKKGIFCLYSIQN